MLKITTNAENQADTFGVVALSQIEDKINFHQILVIYIFHNSAYLYLFPYTAFTSMSLDIYIS